MNEKDFGKLLNDVRSESEIPEGYTFLFNLPNFNAVVYQQAAASYHLDVMLGVPVGMVDGNKASVWYNSKEAAGLGWSITDIWKEYQRLMLLTKNQQ